MRATTHFHARLRERYGLRVSTTEIALWLADIAHGRAEVVWVFPDRGSRVFRLRHRPTGLEVFAVHDAADGVLITAAEAHSFRRTADGWYQRSEGERAAMGVGGPGGGGVGGRHGRGLAGGGEGRKARAPP